MLISKISSRVWAFRLIMFGSLSVTSLGAALPARTVAPLLVTTCSPQVRSLNMAGIVRDTSSSFNKDSVGQALAKAFEEAGSANWIAADSAYQKAWELAPCSCDREHARAGQRAVREAWFAQRMYGMASRPTQLYWSRLQYLTKNLPCVKHD